MESLGGSESQELKPRRVFVLDTSAFLASVQLQLYDAEFYTTNSVVSEVRDEDSRLRLELAHALGRVKVVDPPRHYKHKARRAAVAVGEILSLSETDLDVIAAALYLKEILQSEVIVLTDDYSIQNVLRHLGLKFKSVRTLGIREARYYIAVCPACGRSFSSGAKICPYCGTPLRKKRCK